MSDPSRYAACALLTTTRGDGRSIGYLAPRIAPRVADMSIAGHIDRRPSDRVDRLAARALSDPRLFWRVCDANGALDPLEFGSAGAGRVAVPQPVPGE